MIRKQNLYVALCIHSVPGLRAHMVLPRRMVIMIPLLATGIARSVGDSIRRIMRTRVAQTFWYFTLSMQATPNRQNRSHTRWPTLPAPPFYNAIVSSPLLPQAKDWLEWVWDRPKHLLSDSSIFALHGGINLGSCWDHVGIVLGLF